MVRKVPGSAQLCSAEVRVAWGDICFTFGLVQNSCQRVHVVPETNEECGLFLCIISPGCDFLEHLRPARMRASGD